MLRNDKKTKNADRKITIRTRLSKETETETKTKVIFLLNARTRRAEKTAKYTNKNKTKQANTSKTHKEFAVSRFKQKNSTQNIGFFFLSVLFCSVLFPSNAPTTENEWHTKLFQMTAKIKNAKH